MVFLLDAASRLERRLLRGWIERQRPAGDARAGRSTIPPFAAARAARSTRASSRRSRRATIRCSRRCASRGCRRERDGVREARLSDLLKLGDPRDPGALRQRWIAARASPSAAASSPASPRPPRELRERWRAARARTPAQTTGLAEFVARQAALALERAERRLRGARYKVPRFVREDILARPAFRGGVARLARELGRAEARVAREAGARPARDRRHAQPVRDRPRRAALIRVLYTRGYGEALHYDRAQARRSSARSRSAIRWCSCRRTSRTSTTSCSSTLLHENGHPPNHTAGGINMNFFPVGPLVRRSGVFFIRRTLQGQRGLQVRAAPLHRLPDREALLARVVHRGRALALGQAAAAALRPARLRGRRLPARQERGRRPDPGLDRLRPDPGRRATTPPSSAAARRSARASAGSCASCGGCGRRYGDDPHRASASRSRSRKALGPPDPERRARPRRAEPRAPEARVRGVRAHQPRRRRSRRPRS